MYCRIAQFGRCQLGGAVTNRQYHVLAVGCQANGRYHRTSLLPYKRSICENMRTIVCARLFGFPPIDLKEPWKI